MYNTKADGQTFEPPVLKLTGLCKQYEQKADFAVKDISFECAAGEIVGLLGENGAGKSTTLKCITGMLEPTSGQVEICGYDLKKEPVRAKAAFSFVTDNHAVFEKLTGWQYLGFMADVYKVPESERRPMAEKLESVFKLGKAINNVIATYSHGMKQKICMMGSLMHSPKLWILDEPMIGLDPSSQQSVLEFMREYTASGKTILFSSHNLDLVRRICDRVLVIEKGVLTCNKKVEKEANSFGGSLAEIVSDTFGKGGDND